MEKQGNTDVVLESFADRFQRDPDWDAAFFEESGRPDAGTLKQGRGHQGSRAHDDTGARVCGAGLAALHPFHAGGAITREQEASDFTSGGHPKPWVIGDGIEAVCGTPPVAPGLEEGERPACLGRIAGKEVDPAQAFLLAGLEKGAGEGGLVARRGDREGTAGQVAESPCARLGNAQAAPTGAAERLPFVEFIQAARGGDHGIHGGRPADHAPHRDGDRTSPEPGLRHRGVRMGPERAQAESGQRGGKKPPGVGRAGFEEQDPGVGGKDQTPGKDGSCGASTDEDEVGRERHFLRGGTFRRKASAWITGRGAGESKRTMRRDAAGMEVGKGNPLGESNRRRECS